MEIIEDITYKQDKVKRHFKTSEIYYTGSPKRYYMVIESTGEKYNLLNLEIGTTLFQKDIDYHDMNRVLNTCTSGYELLEESKIVLKGTISVE